MVETLLDELDGEATRFAEAVEREHYLTSDVMRAELSPRRADQ
jgi:hypothetical protein